MKDNRFDGIMIPLDDVSPKALKIVLLTAEKEYSEALSLIEEYISEAEETSQKSTAVIMSLQILALAGYEGIASTLLEALMKQFKSCSKERCVCKRTIKNL